MREEERRQYSLTNTIITTMKTKLFLIPSLIASLFLVSCQDEQTTTVSESLWSGDTIVSRSNSSGTYTRSQYGNDIFGNRTITTTRGHDNATQEGDLLMLLLEGLASAIANSEN